MTIDEALAIGREALTVVLLVAAPCLGVSVAIGFLISVFQATTQIHDQTLTFVPKVLGVVLSLLLFGGWMLRTLASFAERVIQRLPAIGG
ncbi:MAG: flagellar biosynthesis protein FliQ [Bacillota bacterium]|jgi:flagellar biosynthetic protein FliQ